eukprot:1774476-Pyramimonas_sp.AAC.2
MGVIHSDMCMRNNLRSFNLCVPRPDERALLIASSSVNWDNTGDALHISQLILMNNTPSQTCPLALSLDTA